MSWLNEFLPGGLAAFGNPDQVRRGRTLRSVGVAGAVGSILVLAAGKLILEFGGSFSAVLITVLGASLSLIVWTRLWIKESKEPFQYTYSVGEFEAPEFEASDTSSGPIAALKRDLKEKLSERVGRLSLLEEEAVPPAEPGGEPASHVHISGWHGVRTDGDGWELEVVPQVRLGGAGAPARLASSVRLRLDPSTSKRAPLDKRPRLTPAGYEMLFERVYWSVASEIYAQIQIGVERKVGLLPRGTLRASAFVHEAEDYATSNTLDAYSAAQSMYRRALQIYDVRYRDKASTTWRRRWHKALSWSDDKRRRARRRVSEAWRRAGRREVMTARAELGLARMLAAEWHLGRLCGIARKDIYEATEFVDHALDRLGKLPEDLPDRREVLFRTYVTLATIRVLLGDYPGSRKALEQAAHLIPTMARDDADYLFVAGMTEPDRLLSLRLFGQAVALDRSMERALFHRAEEYDKIWRRRDTLEAEVAMTVDAAYRDVIVLNPGNLSAWGRRGYLGWMLAEGNANADSAEWREFAISALSTGRQYKEVRREASVAELDWNLARLAAEQGDFATAYDYYIEAVSARLGDPRIDFESDFYLNPTEALVTRFKLYENRVIAACEQAISKGEVSLRLIKSVKAFVLNDCGLAYQAHYERSGNGESRAEAWKAFETAREETGSFVLPTHNLAKLLLRQAGLPGISSEEEFRILYQAAELLDQVLAREPDWAPARLLMVEVQVTIAERIEASLAALKRERSGAESQGAEPIAAAVDEREQFIAGMEGGLVSCLESAEMSLRKLLPHQQLSENGRTRIDARGAEVGSLVADEGINWTRDFDAFHVSALGLWARLLAITAPDAANRLCRQLRSAYCNADVTLLLAHLGASRALLEAEPENSDARRTEEECTALVRETVCLWLREDPVHWLPLQATGWLTDDERRESYGNALANNPSAPVLIWIGDAQSQMKDFDDALASYERARSYGEAPIVPVAALRIGELFETQGIRRMDAIAAFSLATESEDAALAARAVIKVADLLRQVGEHEEAREEVLRLGSRPEVAAFLGPLLAQEGRLEEAVQVFRAAIATDDDPDRNAALRIRLARTLAPASPAEARDLYTAVGESENPDLAALAISELASMMEEAGEGEAAEVLLQEKAAADPRVAVSLAELRKESAPEDGKPVAVAAS